MTKAVVSRLSYAKFFAYNCNYTPHEPSTISKSLVNWFSSSIRLPRLANTRFTLSRDNSYSIIECTGIRFSQRGYKRLYMSYDAKVFNVMIASPSDVANERNIVRDVIHEWNAVHSDSRKIVLLPIGWETHSSPEIGTAPQDIINRQILSKCDLLVGVFWTRIGTSTQDYASGMVEEIEKHVKWCNNSGSYWFYNILISA